MIEAIIGISVVVIALIAVVVAAVKDRADGNWQANNEFIQKMSDRNRDYFNNPIVEHMKRTDKR